MVIGDSEGHIGLGIKTSKEVATAIRAAIIIAKLSVVPIRRGYWGTNLGEPHSLPTKQSGKCGSVTVRVRNISTVLQVKINPLCFAKFLYLYTIAVDMVKHVTLLRNRRVCSMCVSAIVASYEISPQTTMLTHTFFLVDTSPSRNRTCSFTCCEAAASISWSPRHLHSVFGLYEDT